MTYPIAEHFLSINGEGQHAGELAFFLRFPGCNLSCGYCDTSWANEAGCAAERLTKAEIVQMVKQAGVRNITITGGEPLLQEGMAELLAALSAQPELRVEVETNGSVALVPFLEAAPAVSFTMDYKMPSSGMEPAMVKKNLHLLRPADTLKLVCGSQADLECARALLQDGAVGKGVPVYLSPVFGEIDPAQMVEFMKKWRLTAVRLQLQLHKFIWPPEQRGV